MFQSPLRQILTSTPVFHKVLVFNLLTLEFTPAIWANVAKDHKNDLKIFLTFCYSTPTFQGTIYLKLFTFNLLTKCLFRYILTYQKT